ncbi:hypothetical protein HGRIS_008625 [Hohenbuehelia grisea]|uniref:Dipeptidylpeptidase IV N-terminal domain-containing protein n=1 Tax=Hohenbuehelia grisea TaxID=104357 RepID=A0ABR3J907_9AGAR
MFPTRVLLASLAAVVVIALLSGLDVLETLETRRAAVDNVVSRQLESQPYSDSISESTPQFIMSDSSQDSRYIFEDGENVFQVKDLISLTKVTSGVVNEAGDLVMVFFTRYDTDDGEVQHFIGLSSVGSTSIRMELAIEERDTFFWLDSRTLGRINFEYTASVYTLTIQLPSPDDAASDTLRLTEPRLIGNLPEETVWPSSPRYSQGSGLLVYQAKIVKIAPPCHPEWARFPPNHPPRVSHPTLAAVQLVRNEEKEWSLGSKLSILVDENTHLGSILDAEGFDVSSGLVLYKAFPDTLDEALHDNSQPWNDIYLTHIDGTKPPKKVTGDSKVLTQSSALDRQGSKAAWFELPSGEANSARARIVLYDIAKDTRSTLVDRLDSAPVALVFSNDGRVIYYAAGDEISVSLYVVAIPQSTASPLQSRLPAGSPFTARLVITSPSITEIRPYGSRGLLFTQQNLSSPADIFIIQGHDDTSIQRFTHFNRELLAGKSMVEAENFDFLAHDGLTRRGSVLKPKNRKLQQNDKWPAILILHDGSPGTPSEVWTTLWNPNLFAQQGFFCVVLSTIRPRSIALGPHTYPLGPYILGSKSDSPGWEGWESSDRVLATIKSAWQHALQVFPEIDASRCILLDNSMSGLFEREAWEPVPNNEGLNFSTSETGISRFFYPTYHGFTLDEIMEKYDFLSEVY